MDNHVVASIADRLKEAIEYRHTSAAEVSKATGISRGSLSQYMTGKFSPKQDRIYILSRHLRVSPAWLMGLDVDINGMIDDRHQLLTAEENCMKADMFMIDDVFPRSVQAKLSQCLDTMYELLQLDCKKKSDNELLKKYHALDKSSQLLIDGMIDKLLLTQQMTQKNTTIAESDGVESCEDAKTHPGEGGCEMGLRK